MKILFSITYYHPHISGLTIYAQRLAACLTKRGHRVRVLTSLQQKNLPPQEVADNVLVKRVKVLRKLGKGQLMPGWIKAAWEEAKNTDAIVIHLPQFEGVATALIGRLLGRKVIAVFHCQVVLPKNLSNRIISFALNISTVITLCFSHQITVFTQDYADSVPLLKKFKKKILAHFPPVPVPLVKSGDLSVIAKKIKRQKNERVIGFAGRIAAEKGLEYLIEAVRLLNLQPKTPEAPTFKLVIAGPGEEVVGEENYLKKIDQLIKKTGIPAVFLGALKQEQMGAFYKNLDVLVLPSVNSTEAFGMVQIEAMMLGVPVVASDLPGVRVPVKKFGLGKIAPPKDPSSLAQAILEVINKKDELKFDSQKIRKAFDPAQTAKFFENLLK